ncbi:MAG: hypothetical protein ACLU6Y_02635 [Ruminococcus sp.]
MKKQVSRFHLSKKIYVATTNHTMKVVLRDWCADEWGLDPAGWDNALVYQNTFTSYLSTGQKTAEWKTVSSEFKPDHPESKRCLSGTGRYGM